MSRIVSWSGLVSAVMLAGVVSVVGRAPQGPGRNATPEAPFRFHHVHLNSVDPETAIDFYATHFNAERARFAGTQPAVRAQGKWLLFDRVSQPPASAVVSPLYHIGWGAPDMKATVERMRAAGVAFETPMTDISQVLAAPADRVFFAYVDGPDHAMIEINTAQSDAFQHVHFLSDDPIATGRWFMRHFGLTSSNPNPSPEPRLHNGLQIYPFMGAVLDGVQFYWYTRAFGEGSYPDAWKGRTGFASSRGRVIDHIAFSVNGLDEALARLQAGGVAVVGPPAATPQGFRSAFVRGPDGVDLELVEGHAR